MNKVAILIPDENGEIDYKWDKKTVAISWNINSKRKAEFIAMWRTAENGTIVAEIKEIINDTWETVIEIIDVKYPSKHQYKKQRKNWYIKPWKNRTHQNTKIWLTTDERRKKYLTKDWKFKN